jgi:outer membrane protein TolC
MRTKWFCLLFLSLIALPLPTLGGFPIPDRQDLQHITVPTVADGPSLTLTAAIDEALSHNLTLAALRAQFEVARQRPAQERFLMPPTFEAQIWQWPIDTLNPLNTNMYMFTVTQELPGRGKRDLRAAVAAKDAERASNEIAVRARQVIDEVKRAYAALLVNRKAIEIHQASVELLRQFADASTVKYTAGRSSQQDVLKAVVEISKLHSDLVMFDERTQLAAAQLNTLLNRPTNALIGPLSEPQERQLVPTVDELQRIALGGHPELRSAQLEVEGAQANLALVDRESKPDFSVGGGYMLMPRQAGAWTATVGMTWPAAPWSRGRLDARKAEATAEVEAARARQRAMESQLRLAVHEAYVRARSAEQRAALLRTSVVPQSQQTLEVSRVAYQADRADFLALIDNQRTLLDVQLEYYRALSDSDQALADLERAIGVDMTPAMLRTPNSEEGK